MSNRIGEYGTPEQVLINGALQDKYPTEVYAAFHMLHPNAARFVPAPGVPLLECCRCKHLKPFEAFDADSRYTLRKGRRTECKLCRSLERKLQRLQRILKPSHERGARAG